MDYRHLLAWQKAMALAETVYRETAALPAEERYGLTAQMRRAVVSVPSNIAEGQGRHSTDGEFVRYLNIAHGSLCELDTQLELASRLKFLTPDAVGRVRPASEEVGRILNGLIRSKQHQADHP
jgi:four helix bundle protein